MMLNKMLSVAATGLAALVGAASPVPAPAPVPAAPHVREIADVTEEADIILSQIPSEPNAGGTGGGDTKEGGSENTEQIKKEPSPQDQISTNDLNGFLGYSFYFENDCPYYNPDIQNPQDPAEWKIAGPLGRGPYSTQGANQNYDYEQYYNFYLSLRDGSYVTKAPEKCYAGGYSEPFTKDGIQKFFDNTVIYNFEK